MEFAAVIIIAAVVFGLCFLVDRAFIKIFRSQAQHKSGLCVRLNKRYGAMGLVLIVLGIAAVFTGMGDGWVLPAGGALLVITGISLTVYYMTFGVFYDEDGFVLTTFGKHSAVYTYKDIAAQQLYSNHGSYLIELHLTDGRVFHLQSTMAGAYAFLDYAFDRWCSQTGRDQSQCSFYDPANSCWFPTLED